ncbi:hypothetical protein CGK12_20615, partial [Vibrio parahaemolyticus]
FIDLFFQCLYSVYFATTYYETQGASNYCVKRERISGKNAEYDKCRYYIPYKNDYIFETQMGTQLVA